MSIREGSANPQVPAVLGEHGAGGDAVFGGAGGSGRGVVGTSDTHVGVEGFSKTGIGVYGSSTEGRGVVGVSTNNTAIEGHSTNGWSGYFGGKVFVEKNLEIGGDVILQNADCAEDFDIAAASQAEPGTVMVIDDSGALRESRAAYDRRVAGVISGAGDYKPGIVLDKQKGKKGRKPLALVGKVYCKVDASFGAIAVGDLLTTSPTPGHAMKADGDRATGALIGKALRSLAEGQGLIPILVALQ